MKPELLLFVCAALLCSCVPEQPAGPPEPIGEELMGFTTALGVPGCAEAHLYRAREAVQYQCFSSEGMFSWENHGTLSEQGRADLEAALAAADPTSTTPSDAEGLCDEPESESATMTLWVGSRSVSYPPGCPVEGVEALHELVMTLLGDIGDCIELDMLESVEDGCRAY